MTASILVYFNSDLKYVFKVDLSNHAQKDMFSQYNKNNMLYLIVFFHKN